MGEVFISSHSVTFGGPFASLAKMLGGRNPDPFCSAIADSERMFSEAAASKVLTPFAGAELVASAASHSADRTQTATASGKAAKRPLLGLDRTRKLASSFSLIAVPRRFSGTP